MLITEWNMVEALAVAKEEGAENGRKERDEEILGLIKKGYTLMDIENMLKSQLGG